MKRVFIFLLISIFMFNMSSFAQGVETCVIYDLDNYKVIAKKYPVAAPHFTAYTYNNYGVVDKDGNTVVESIYSKIFQMKEGRAAFKTNDGNIGFFDENWNIVIEPKYFSNGPDIYFSEGCASVGKRHETKFIVWGYIDLNGNEITDFIYDEAMPFENGEASVGIDEEVYGGFHTKTKWGKIDKSGKVTQPFKFGYALGFDYEYLWQDPIDVLLSENLVEIDGKVYRNSDIEYPFINYLGYSYMPLTYYGMRMLGINCDWTKEDGVILSNGGTKKEDITGKNDMTEGVYDKAMFYKGNLTINGKVYRYGDTAYPLIHYKDVVYMPVVWENGMNELGIDYEFVGAEKLENSTRGKMVFKIK